MSKVTLTVTDRERDTILAALRHYQASTIISDAIRDIANNDHDNPLSEDEIDTLCEDINCG
jgi:predicted proteasome-type protease